jgi:hypothetical protein
VSRVSQAFGMLKFGRISAVVTNQFNGLKFTSSEIIELPNPVLTKPYYLLASYTFYEQFPEFTKRVWQTSEQVREQHYLDLLLKYQHMGQWEN